jgi:precorrin-6B methylase 2
MITWILLMLSLGITLLVTVFMFWNVFAIVRGAPYVPSSAQRIEDMTRLATLSRDDVMMDVGSGDGRIVRHVAHMVEQAIGIEINPVLAWYARIMNYMGRYTNVQILQKNFWTVSLADIDVLFVYCIDGKMTRLEDKIRQEMKPGSRIVSNGFVLPTLRKSQSRSGAHLYILSENVSVV